MTTLSGPVLGNASNQTGYTANVGITGGALSASTTYTFYLPIPNHGSRSWKIKSVAIRGECPSNGRTGTVTFKFGNASDDDIYGTKAIDLAATINDVFNLDTAVAYGGTTFFRITVPLGANQAFDFIDFQCLITETSD